VNSVSPQARLSARAILCPGDERSEILAAVERHVLVGQTTDVGVAEPA
jgi:hypothetical protein